MSETDAPQDPFAVPSQPGSPPRAPLPLSDVSADIKKRLGSARWTLIIVGLLMLAYHAYLFFNATHEIDALIQAEGEMHIDASTAVLILRVIYGVASVSGLVFLCLGALVYRFPLLCPLVGLLMFVGLNGFYGLLEPATLARGAIMKIIILVILFQAVQSGLQVRQERAEAYNRMFGMRPGS